MPIRCNSVVHHEDGNTSTVLYDCAQSEHNHRVHEKHEDLSKRRDKRETQHFPCRGALKLVVSDDSDTVIVRFRHEVDHVKFERIDVPQDIIELIDQSLDKTPAQVRSHTMAPIDWLNINLSVSCGPRF